MANLGSNPDHWNLSVTHVPVQHDATPEIVLSMKIIIGWEFFPTSTSNIVNLRKCQPTMSKRNTICQRGLYEGKTPGVSWVKIIIVILPTQKASSGFFFLGNFRMCPIFKKVYVRIILHSIQTMKMVNSSTRTFMFCVLS